MRTLDLPPDAVVELYIPQHDGDALLQPRAEVIERQLNFETYQVTEQAYVRNIRKQITAIAVGAAAFVGSLFVTAHEYYQPEIMDNRAAIEQLRVNKLAKQEKWVSVYYAQQVVESYENRAKQARIIRDVGFGAMACSLIGAVNSRRRRQHFEDDMSDVYKEYRTSHLMLPDFAPVDPSTVPPMPWSTALGDVVRDQMHP